MEYKLTYILTTYNKLSYLQQTLPDLVNACREDEEIVVMDGGSKDGSVEFINQFFLSGKIHQFESAPDYGEAHGYNKAILKARGALIKVISDDDAYDYEAIQKCKTFMLENPQFDILGSEGLSISLALNHEVFRETTFLKDFEVNKFLFFTGLSIMFRKSSIPLTGLFHTGYIIVDLEYVYRLHHMKAKIALYDGYLYTNIVNPNSNSYKHWVRLLEEKERLERFYGFIVNSRFNNVRMKIWRAKLSKYIKGILGREDKPTPSLLEYADIYKLSVKKLKEFNTKNSRFHAIDLQALRKK